MKTGIGGGAGEARTDGRNGDSVTRDFECDGGGDDDGGELAPRRSTAE